MVFEAAPANPPRAPSRPEVPHLRSKAKCAKVKITKSKSQIEDPKLNNSYIIFKTGNCNTWDQLLVETSFLNLRAMYIYIYLPHLKSAFKFLLCEEHKINARCMYIHMHNIHGTT